MQEKIFISREIISSSIDFIRNQGFTVEVWNKSEVITKKQLIERCQDATGLISMLADAIDQEFLESCPHLKVISNYAVGTNNIDLKFAKSRGIAVGNTPDVLTDSTADTAFALLIATSRRIVEAANNLAAWKTWEPLGYIGHALKGKTIGIVGMGRIGEAMAKRCHGGWDMNILYTANTQKPEVEKKFGARKVELDELLAQSDFVSLHCPLTDKTKGLLNFEALKKMKSTAILINTARGDVMIQDDLVRALNEKIIWGAGLDVTSPEPLPLTHPLCNMGNVVITPHIGSADFESREAMGMLCAQNIIAGIRGLPLPAEVK